MESVPSLRRKQRSRSPLGMSETAQLIAARDWSTTALGPLDEWPEALWQALTMILHSSSQLAIYWGPELILLYNDAERKPLGDMHPAALGQPARVVLAEIWDVVGPVLETVLARGESTWSEDAPLVFDRGRGLEEAFFSWSYSPIFGDRGTPEGVLLVSTETTRRVIGERRLRCLNSLDERLLHLPLDEVLETAVATVVEDDDVAVAEIHLVRGGTSTCVASCGRGTPLPLTLGPIHPAVAAALEIHDEPVAARARIDGGADASVLCIRLPTNALPDAVPVLVLAFSPLRKAGESEREYARLVGRHVAAAATDAAAREDEREEARARAVVAERKRMERDLHDSIQRQLLGAQLVTALMRDPPPDDPAGGDVLLEELSALLSSASADLRDIVSGRYPSLLAKAGVAGAVRDVAVTARLEIAIDGDPGRFDEAAEHGLYYVVVEALQNASKHAGPDAVARIRFRRESRRVVALVQDSGVGFVPGEVVEGKGLANMRERAAASGASIRVRARPGAGTIVRWICPLS